MIYPVLSIRQYWAGLIVLGIKDAENRSWPLPAKYRSTPVLIHTGVALADGFSSPSDMSSLALEHGGWEQEEVWRRESLASRIWQKGVANARCGIIGVATFIGCVQNSRSPWAMPDAWHWLIGAASPVRHYACRGQLGFFQVDYPYPVPDLTELGHVW